MDSPLVSVVIPVYNASAYLREAIDSMLGQSYPYLELILINDGSTDDSRDIISSYADSRIRLVDQPVNTGIIECLNKGFSLSKGKYIARMDADDVSAHDRIEKQVALMESNPSVGIAASYTQHNKRFGVYAKKRLSSAEIKSRLLFDNILPHPTVIFRRKVLEENNLQYDRNYPHAEDYALWLSAITVADYALIPEPLIRYRTHAAQVSKLKKRTQAETVQKVHLEILRKMGITADKEEQQLHSKLYFLEYEYNSAFLIRTERWLQKMKKANELSKIFDPQSFATILSWTWFEVCTDFASKKINSKKALESSDLYRPAACSLLFRLKFRLKCFLAR